MSSKKLYYLAGPYTHSNPNIMHYRASKLTRTAIDLLKKGIYTFSPISYNSPWTKIDESLPHEWEFWEEIDFLFLSRCDGIIVLQLDGWEKSRGVLAEINYAKNINIPVYFLDPENVTDFKI